METSKIVDDLLVTLKYQEDASPRSCFVVFSSREEHVEVVIDCIETIVKRMGKYDVVRLDEHLKSGDSQYGELTVCLSRCCFAIVILDGFRPNVLFEYGILKGLGKPCIVLLEENATVDIQNFFPSSQKGLPPGPSIDMDKHFSDMKDRFYVRYNRNEPKQIRVKLKAEYSKLKERIEDEFLHSLFPHKEVVEKELKAHLRMIADSFSKPKDKFDENDVPKVDFAHSHVERIANEHGITVPHRYFSTLALTYEKAGAVDKAIAVVDSSLTGTPDDIFVLHDKFHILRRAGRIDEAIEALDAAIKLNPKAEFLWHNKGITLDKLGRVQEAILCYKKAIRLRSGCPLVHYHYGALLYEKDDFTAALAQLDKAHKMEPANPVFRLWKARALNICGKSDDAHRIIDELILEYPDDANVWFVLGCIEKNDSKKLEHFQKAVQLDPKHGGAICSSASALSNIGRHDEAIKIFLNMSKYCLRHESCPILMRNISSTLVDLGRAEEAIKACDKMLAKNPMHFGALEGKAICLERLGRAKEAIKLCDKILAENPVHHRALVIKAISLARMEEYSASLAIFSELLSANPADASLWYDEACVYALAKKSREAVRSLRKAIAMDATYKESAKSDNDFDSMRRTKAFRVAIGEETQGRRKQPKRKGVVAKRDKNKKRATKTSSRRPKGRI